MQSEHFLVWMAKRQNLLIIKMERYQGHHLLKWTQKNKISNSYSILAVIIRTVFIAKSQYFCSISCLNLLCALFDSILRINFVALKVEYLLKFVFICTWLPLYCYKYKFTQVFSSYIAVANSVNLLMEKLSKSISINRASCAATLILFI